MQCKNGDQSFRVHKYIIALPYRMAGSVLYVMLLAVASVVAQDYDIMTEAPQQIDLRDLQETPTLPPADCRYYCLYRGEVYCCDDGTRELPPDHDTNLGTCPKMAYHVCKSDGIFYKNKEHPKAGFEELFSGSPKDSPPCASDGYCGENEKCCPSECAGKHVCLKAMACRYYCAWDGQPYCCDDGSLEMPEDHDDKAGECPSLESEVCLPWKASLYAEEDSAGPYTPCASDGYCGKGEKCCPSRCAWRHVCLTAMPSAPQPANTTDNAADLMDAAEVY